MAVSSGAARGEHREAKPQSPPAVHSPKPGAPGRLTPQVFLPPHRAGQHCATGSLSARLQAVQTRSPPAAHSRQKSRGPRGPDKAPQPQGRGSPEWPKAARAAMSAGGPRPDLAAEQAPVTLSFPALHTRRERPQLSSSPRSRSARARAKVSARPARAAPGTSTSLGRSPAPKNFTGAPRGNHPGPPAP
ncbi:hypothetical protein NDU88_001053 [Pleurodeles waltl]|uniref:Uncharacterized protein n=1 Tax=Pleurodeles waltl TaxID=8319 RepID=A0AAV7WL21_PLEWA|nr:hypothetical protein NDU88_001053 [Pleurodeles waltl]